MSEWNWWYGEPTGDPGKDCDCMGPAPGGHHDDPLAGLFETLILIGEICVFIPISLLLAWIFKCNLIITLLIVGIVGIVGIVPSLLIGYMIFMLVDSIKEKILEWWRNLVGRDNVTSSIESGMVCPHCGKQMVLRTGKYGKFWGCSSFPRCRHTEPYK